ncbi:hypothetical protein J3R30DRAFT_2399474 [Lentinula aciculospora]|uniref:F-box domain-containing protein n=1 Tax=Lentinula aciculospora TaxID=153920 RepID=A0A9W9AFW9_9AGAR|nr:hypothetical protein J3R30DRAFT_2399474 [Lentinula aciculospora]
MSLPNDVWLQIIDYISPLALQELYSVNSTFFNVAMDQRYQQISFSYLSRKMIWTLARLKDPAVAKRVRILHLYPHFVKDALDTMDLSSSQSLLSKFGELAGLIRDQKKLILKQKPRLPLKFKTCRDLMQVMMEIFSGLPNLTDYHVLWCGLPSVGSDPALVLSSPLRLNLRCLRLEISLEKLQYMLLSSYTQSLPDLQELDLFIRVEHLNMDRYDTILLMLARMISSLHPSLRKLTVQLWEPFDLSPLFAAISHLPLLDKLSLSIPMSYPNLGNPDGLIGFLNAHSNTLRSLSIRASELGGRSLMMHNELQLGAWMDETFSKVHLSCITTLEISLYLVPFDSALLCVKTFSSTLTSLVFTGLHLTYEDLDLLTAALSRRDRKPLHYARIGPLSLSPQLVDLFAHRFPEMDKLELLVKSIVPFDGDVPMFCGRSNSDRDQDEGQVGRFIEEMKHRHYPGWKLHYLDLTGSSYPRLMNEEQYKGVFMQCVPALRTVV